MDAVLDFLLMILREKFLEKKPFNNNRNYTIKAYKILPYLSTKFEKGCKYQQWTEESNLVFSQVAKTIMLIKLI